MLNHFKGWNYPVNANKSNGKINEAIDNSLINQSIKMILSTKKGERFLYPEFGCDLYKFMFGSADYTTLNQIKIETQNSLLKWEKRIDILNVNANIDKNDPNKIIINIEYKIGNINSDFHYTHTLPLN